MADPQQKFSLCTRFVLGTAVLSAIAFAVRSAARRKRRIDFNGKTVLISGASRGLGLELARGFADEGADLVLLARDVNTLAESAKELRRYGVKVDIFAVDIANRQANAALKTGVRLEREQHFLRDRIHDGDNARRTRTCGGSGDNVVAVSSPARIG